MPERDPMCGKPHLQGAHQGPRRVLDEMREPIVRYRFAPMAQDRLGLAPRVIAQLDVRA